LALQSELTHCFYVFLCQAEARARRELEAMGHTEVPLVRHNSLEGLLDFFASDIEEDNVMSDFESGTETQDEVETEGYISEGAAPARAPKLVRQNTRTKGLKGSRANVKVSLRKGGGGWGSNGGRVLLSI
jgi:hypothetical protein